MSAHGIEKTAEHWDRYWAEDTEHRALWLSHPLIQQRLNQLRGGLALDDWFIRNHLKGRPVQRGLGIGSGASMLELLLVKHGMVEEYDIFDVSQAALDEARATAREFGIEARVRFLCEDINRVTIPENTYNLVTFISSLHHMSALDSILRRVQAALTSGGILFADEYIGPDRFDFPAPHMALARQIYRVLDPGLSGPWPDMPLPNPTALVEAHPTEAVHSADILDTVARVFSTVDVTPMQNTLPFILWPNLNHAALFETEQGHELVRFMIAVDDALISARQLPDYLALIVATK